MTNKVPEISIDNKLRLLEYTILKLVEWQCEVEKQTLNVFFKKNNFSKDKVLLLPFFISSANGKDTRKMLFGFFNSFIADDLGYVEKTIKADNFIGLNFIFSETFGNICEFKTKALLESDSIAAFILDFRKNNILPPPEEHEDFSDYYALVDHSIKIYKDNDWFIWKYSDLALIRLCRRHSGWQAYRMLEKYDVIISKSILINENSVYSAEVSNRILV